MSCEPPPHPDDQDDLVTDSQNNLLVTLLNQMEQNWDHGDNAANDDLVLQIREHIRQEKTAISNEAAPA